MSLTLYEVKERLMHRYDTEDLIVLLDIGAEELLDRFEDKLLMKIDEVMEEVQ